MTVSDLMTIKYDDDQHLLLTTDIRCTQILVDRQRIFVAMNDSNRDGNPAGTDAGSLRREVDRLRHRVAELEQAARARDEGENHFRAIFEHSNDATFLYDVEDDRIIDANVKAEALLGYTRDELLQLSVSAIHPDEMDKVQAFAQDTLAKGHGWTDELSCLTKGGGLVAAEISASVVEVDGRTCVVSSMRDVSERERLANENAYLRGELESEARFGEIVGKSAALRKALEQVRLVAATDANVLITGESGTGKELIARAIHEQSARREAALVRVNCASIPSELFESEFFGHVKGAFTGAVQHRIGRFELADGGTLFLDEVAEIPLALQSKLLRVLQEGQFERVGESRTRRTDVRLIAATNRNLTSDVKAGRFREDLYYRLSVFPIEAPPLRERREDIALLARHFIDDACRRHGLAPLRLSKAQARHLESQWWPGNVRELQNAIERAVIRSQGKQLRFDERTGADPRPVPPSAGDAPDLGDMTLADLDDLERDIIVRALQQSDGKVYGDDGAAAALDLKPTTLAYRMKRLGVARRQGK